MRTGFRTAWLFAWAWLCLTALSWAVAQQSPPNDNIKLQANKDDDFWFSSAKRRAASAAQLVLARNPLTIAVMRFKSFEELIWADLEFAHEFAPPLNPDWLDEVADHRVLPDVRGKTREEMPKWVWPTYEAYCQALIYSFRFHEDAFKKSAKENADLKFPHLWNEPKIHRGKVIPVQGRLVRIRKYEAPWPAKREGIQHVYEGWLYGDTKNSTPYCVIFTVPPEGVQVAETLRRQASFEGYFLGRFKFRVGAVGDQRDIDIPLFIGPTIHVAQELPPAIDDTPFSLIVLIGVVALLVGLVAVICAISWWFRKGDSAIQAKLAVRKEQETLAMMENPDQWNLPAEAIPQPQTGITAEPPEPPRGS